MTSQLSLGACVQRGGSGQCHVGTHGQGRGAMGAQVVSMAPVCRCVLVSVLMVTKEVFSLRVLHAPKTEQMSTWSHITLLKVPHTVLGRVEFTQQGEKSQARKAT